ncbi:hypothetical protein [Streptacidiphilus rugosus]|uniref:hypothetical protein n=1 Tax=Streptacidiphilus rugosus TaxID=405783 RepID=UPI000561C29A|nr:hypothetical protein [Streptacidiphilus rugosus]
MNAAVRRTVLVLLAAVGLWIGGWAYLAPDGWYRSFPGLGHHWLPPLGPANQHLASDVGAFYLALAVLTLAAARRPLDRPLARAAATTWLVFSVLHLGFHVRHLDMYGAADQALNLVALTLVPAAALLLLLPPPRRRRPGDGPAA